MFYNVSNIKIKPKSNTKYYNIKKSEGHRPSDFTSAKIHKIFHMLIYILAILFFINVF